MKGKWEDYTSGILPAKAEVDFIFKGDFDGDHSPEVLLGYTIWDEYPYEFTVLLVKANNQGFCHQVLLTTAENQHSLYDSDDDIAGVCDSAFVADTDGDSKPELILSLTVGNGHFVTGYIIGWQEGKPSLIWRTPSSYAHGRLELVRSLRKGVYDIAIEESTDYGTEILSLSEAGPHVRRRTRFSWDGQSYFGNVMIPSEDRYIKFNLAVAFLQNVVKRNYKKAYSLVELPMFMGLAGLDDASCNAFSKYLEKHVRPKLIRNLTNGLLEPIDDSYFQGAEDSIQFTFNKVTDKWRISGIDFLNRGQITDQ